MSDIRSPLQAQVVEWHVKPGDIVNAGDLLVMLEAMR
jgi:biotin carboxyl carrier protein